MYPEKSPLTQSVKFTVILLIIMAVELVIVLKNNKQNIQSNPPANVYHPSVRTIENYFLKEDYRNAYKDVLKYGKEHPDDPAVNTYLGDFLFRIEKYSESTKYFESVLKDKKITSSAEAEIYYFIGRNHDHLKATDSAILYFQKAIKTNSDYALPYDILGAKALRNKKYDEALSFFEKELSLPVDPKNDSRPSAYYYLAQVYFETNKYDKALQMLKKAQESVQLIEPKPTQLLDDIKNLQKKIEEN